MKSLTEEDSKRITALRFLLIVFVVFIHNNLKADEAINYYHLDFLEPVAITWLKAIVTNVLGGAAVPLFFLFAGFLQFSKDDSYKMLLKKRAKSLLVPYIAWTLLNVLFYFIAQSIPQLSSFFQNENNIVKNWNFVDWLNLFWIHDVGNGHQMPLVFQFWFVRDLIVLIVFSPLLRFIAKKAPFLTLVAITLCYLNPVPMGFGTAIFFYMAGFFFAEYGISFFKLADKIRYGEYAILLLLSAFVSVKNPECVKLHSLGTIFSCLFFLKLSLSIIKNEKLFSLSKYLAGFSFFLYAIHTPFLGTSLNKISYRLIPLHGFGCLVQFIVPSLLCVAIGTAGGIALKKLCPPLYKVFNGSR